MGRKADKPEGARSGWKLLRSETRFEDDLQRLRDDEVELAGGKRIHYAYLERADAVIVVPITSAGEMILLKQYRYTVDEWCLEVPGGGMHDAAAADLEEVARKELREEVGATAQELRAVGFFYPANAMSDETCHVFLAEGVEFTGEQKTEASETIEIERVSVRAGLELARSGAIKTGPSALAILLCEPFLARYLAGANLTETDTSPARP